MTTEKAGKIQPEALGKKIKEVAKALATARRIYVKEKKRLLIDLAKQIGFAEPGQAYELIDEAYEIQADFEMESEANTEEALIVFTQEQRVEWKKAELDEQINALKTARAQLGESS